MTEAMWLSDIKFHLQSSRFGSTVCLCGSYFNKAWGENPETDGSSALTDKYREAASLVNSEKANGTLSVGEQTVFQHYNSKLKMISQPQRKPLSRCSERQVRALLCTGSVSLPTLWVPSPQRASVDWRARLSQVTPLTATTLHSATWNMG